ncbi:winged helix-turn-helix domain-containing protein [Shewanella sp. Arc9-LZ]|jgi:DNA-binding winged helix-turn-helix (wHTH) protein|uniref:nSTAND1 domain-containing NTPase n=2 Tax=unclassified Shewanella TaxID=196818 RepID=UPI00137BF413|nr:winged helix-turn-helix domain-containing protein [Shewanella sp. Arc9-LZ]QHS12404.1 tetratricopeptide repeat protein [Shewanella sp. Arc9-LZ]
MNDSTFFFGDWQINPHSNSIQSGDVIRSLEPKAMDVLRLLCQHQGEVLAADDIINHCWNNIAIGDNPLHKVITQLRKALGDQASNPQYIETIRKRGYRTIASVEFPIGHHAKVTTQQWQGASPFPGLRAFDTNDSNVFFGRSEQVDTLLNRITKQVEFGRAFCLILGPSGTGKSSLINAGIMPNLMSKNGFNGVGVIDNANLDLADVTKGRLIIDIASAMLDWEINDQAVFTDCSADMLANKLQNDIKTVIEYCQLALAKYSSIDDDNAPKYSRPHFSLFIDRLEILLASPLFTESERNNVLDILETLAVSGVVLIISACRNDFYPQVVSHPSLMAGKANGSHFDLSAPTRSELMQMIRLPANAANLTWTLDPDTAMPLDEILCSEAASNPDALPMLQYTLQSLYLNKDDNNQLLVSVYHSLGGIEGAIGKNAEEVLNQLNNSERAALPKILSMLVTLTEDEKSITSSTARWSDLSSDAEINLVKAMVDNRLFVSHLQQDQACFSIAHEALLRRWPRATQWITEHKDSLAIKSRLQHQSNRWLAESKSSAYLLAEGKPLAEASTLLNNQLFNLEPQELALIQASSKQANIGRWRRRAVMLALVTLTLISVAMSVRSIEAETQAQQKRLAAENLLGFMVGEFADKMRGIGRMDLLDGISNKALEYFSDFSADDASYLSFEAQFQHSQTLEAMGEVAYSRGNTDEARSALIAARERMQPLLEIQPQNLSLLKTLGANAYWIGLLEYDKSDWLATQPWFEQYLTYSQAMYQYAPDDDDALMELSYAQNSLGSIHMKQQNFAAAREAFEQSLQLKQKVLVQDPSNSKMIADVANAQSWIASAATAQGDITAAIQIHQQIQQQLANQALEKQPYLLERLSSSYGLLAKLLNYQGKHQEVFSTAELRLATITKAFKQDPQNDILKIQQYYAYFDMLTYSSIPIENTMGQSINSLAAMLETDATLTTSSKKNELWAKYQLAAANYLASQGQLQKSLLFARQAITSFNQLITEFHQNTAYTADLAESTILTAILMKSIEPSQQVNVQCKQTKNQLALIIDNNSDPKYTIPYAKALDCLGELNKYPDLLQLLDKSAITNYRFTPKP